MKPRVLIPAAGLLITGGILFLIFFQREDEAAAPSSRQKNPSMARRPVGMSHRPERISREAPQEKSADVPSPADAAPQPLTPEQEKRVVQAKASAVYKMALTYAMAHDGAFPPDLSALVASGLMPPEKAGEFLSGVIEYNGSELTNRDMGREVLMRYRLGKNTDEEVRVHVSGSVNVRQADEPSDAPPVPSRQ